MINIYDCASTYLTQFPYSVNVNSRPQKRKVEDVKSVHNGTRYNYNAANKANAGHIDISI